ncbi:MAG: SBBP repeat-containing protein [Pseudomonadota bacterium]
MSFFAPTQNSGFQFVTINANLLSGIFQAQTAVATAGTLSSTTFAQQEPAVTAPWQLNEEPQPLNRRIASVRQQTSFINTDAATVSVAGNDVDARATFTLFNALEDLRTLAEYASQERTLDSELARLDATFQTGLQQVQQYAGSETLDKLDLLFGDKDSKVTSSVDVGEDSNDYGGAVIQTGARTDPIPGLDGTEVFSISLTKSGRTDTISVDLSQITGDISIDAVVELINTQISSLKLVDADGNPELDEQGNPILDAEGNPVDRYLTRFEVRSNDNFDWLIGTDGVSTETVVLSAPAAQPSVFVASSFDSVVTDAATKARVNSFTSTGTAFESTGRSDVSATSAGLTALAEDVASANGTNIVENPIDPVAVETQTFGIAADSQGFSYIVGTTAGDLDNQLSTGKDDVFLTKLDSQGQIVYQRLVGSSDDAQGFAVTVDANDNVIIAGQTRGQVDEVDVFDGGDSFVVKYDTLGREVFRTQLDSVVTDAALAVTTNAAGEIFVGGYADGNINTSTSSNGGRDGLVLKLDAGTGAIADIALLGGAGTDQVTSLAVDAAGNLFAALEQDGNGTIVKLDGTNLSSTLAQTDLGNLAGGSLSAIAVTGADASAQRIVVAGTTGNPGGLSGGTALNASSGGFDAFVTTLVDGGSSISADQTRFIGTAASDSATGLALSGDDIFVTGRTGDALDGQTRQGPQDGFVAKIDLTSGSLDALNQFGAFGGRTDTAGIAVSNAGSSTLEKLGLRSGQLGDTQDRTLGTQSSLKDGEYFYVAVDGRPARRIDVNPGDSFRTIAARINVLGLRSVKAEEKNGQLEIEAINDGRIDLIAGPEGRDALVRLGFEPQSILSSERLFNFEDDRPPEEQLGGSFALGLDTSFNLRDKTTAKYVLSQLDSAISTVQRAFRSLTFDPIAFELSQQSQFSGPVPTRLSNQLANYQAGLARLQAGSLSSTSFFA